MRWLKAAVSMLVIACVCCSVPCVDAKDRSYTKINVVELGYAQNAIPNASQTITQSTFPQVFQSHQVQQFDGTYRTERQTVLKVSTPGSQVRRQQSIMRLHESRQRTLNTLENLNKMNAALFQSRGFGPAAQNGGSASYVLPVLRASGDVCNCGCGRSGCSCGKSSVGEATSTTKYEDYQRATSPSPDIK